MLVFSKARVRERGFVEKPGLRSPALSSLGEARRGEKNSRVRAVLR